ncbi:MAG: DMT family transporter [Zetaproteobacteria bacterium]|nr:DMT family transporter [Zetaproteobacteria bacterium]
MALVFLMYAAFGSVFTAAKICLDHCLPFFMVGSRMLIAASLILVFLGLRGRLSFRLLKQHAFEVVMLGVFNIYLTNGLEFWGMQFLTSSKTSFIYSLSPFIAALISFFFLGERLSKVQWVGLVIGFFGFLPIFVHTGSGEFSLESFGVFSLAELAVMGAATAATLGWMFMKKLMLKGYSPLEVNAWSMLVGAFLSLAHSWVVEPWDPVPVTGSTVTFIQATLWMVIVSNLFCYNLYGYLLRSFSVTFMSFAGFSTAFFAALWGAMAIGEVPSREFFLSGIVVFCGLFLFYRDEMIKHGIRIRSVS